MRVARETASRLQARLGAGGSPEYSLTWKAWAMPSRAPICALRASGRRTSDSGCIGWPTPSKQNAEGGPIHSTDRGFFFTLQSAARLAGWTTPQALSFADSHQPGNNRSMNTTVALVGWHTPSSTDYKGSSTEGQRENQLTEDVLLVGWPTPNGMTGGQTSRGGDRQDEALMGGIVSGLTPTLSSAATGKPAGYRLNPCFSLWLMGFPVFGWVCCGVRAMRLCRRSGLRLSGRSSNV